MLLGSQMASYKFIISAKKQKQANNRTQNRQEQSQRRNKSYSIQFSSQENEIQNKATLKHIARKYLIHL
jgi:hypothetical protein